MMRRREFSVAVKTAAKNRCEANGWLCEDCGLPIIGRPEYDHIAPDGLGGEPTLDNCAVLCSKFHSMKTHQRDRPIMAKADRQMKKAAGIKSKGRGFRQWRRFDGTIVHKNSR